MHRCQNPATIFPCILFFDSWNSHRAASRYKTLIEKLQVSLQCFPSREKNYSQPSFHNIRPVDFFFDSSHMQTQQYRVGSSQNTMLNLLSSFRVGPSTKSIATFSIIVRECCLLLWHVENPT